MKARRRAPHVVAVARAVRRIKDGVPGVNAGRKRAIVTHLRDNPGPVRRADLGELVGVHESHLHRLLVELIEEGLVRRVSPGHYQLECEGGTE